MDLLKKHGEKILFLFLLVLLAGSVFIILQEQGSFGRAKEVAPKSSKASVSSEDADRLLGLLTTNRLQVTVSTTGFTPKPRRVCVSDEHDFLIPEGVTNCPFCGTGQTGIGNDTDGDGMPDQEEMAMGLDMEDPTDVFKDHDGDGFFTLLEWQLKTDPMESDSHPPLADYLHLKELDQKSIQFEFRGFSKLNERDYTLQLRWKYPGQRRWQEGFVRTGRRFGANNEFQAQRFVEKTVRRDGKYIDESYVTIQVGRHNLKLGVYGEAAKGKVTESLATLHTIAGPSWEQVVRPGATFELDNKSYMVIDILRDSVVVKPDDADDAIALSFATPEDIKAVTPPEQEVDPDAPGPEGLEGMPEMF